MSNKTTTITGRAAVVVSKYTGFDMSNPGATKAHNFSFLSEEYVKDGKLDSSWTKDGFRLVGVAEIKVEIMPAKSMLKGAVDALKAEKEKVLADAQREATRLESEIQKLLAIEYEVTA